MSTLKVCEKIFQKGELLWSLTFRQVLRVLKDNDSQTGKDDWNS
jgi:hypothetical protein